MTKQYIQGHSLANKLQGVAPISSQLQEAQHTKLHIAAAIILTKQGQSPQLPMHPKKTSGHI
jgi:hypothetical protein